MKRLLLTAILAASATACVDGNNPVQLLDAQAVDPTTCTASDTIVITRGRLNYDASTHYVMTFALFSTLDADTQTTQGTGAGFVANEVEYSYEVKKLSVTLKDEALPIYLVVGGTASADGASVNLDLIGDEARKKLDSIVPAAPDTLTLVSKVKLKGKLGSGRTVETNEVAFPIELTRSGGCTSGTPMPLPAAPCYPGQDGVGFTCG